MQIANISMMCVINANHKKKTLKMYIPEQNIIEEESEPKKINTLSYYKSRNLPQGSRQCIRENPQIFDGLFKHSNKLIVIINAVWKYSAFMLFIVPK